MEDSQAAETLLTFFKSLSDASRPKMVALLAQQALSVEQQALSDMARRLLSTEALPAVAAGIDTDAYDRAEGRLRPFPAQQKKELAILRRRLVDLGLMQREGGGGEYWRSAHEG